MARKGDDRDDRGRQQDDYDRYDDYPDGPDSAEYQAHDRRDSQYADDHDDHGRSDHKNGKNAKNSKNSKNAKNSSNSRALAPVDNGVELDVYRQDASKAPTVIPGTGVSMGNPFIKRRARPLTMGLTILTVVATLIVTGLMSATPLGAAAQPGMNSFEELAGSVVMTSDQQYVWYTAQWGDSLDSIASKFKVQIGGIMELNGLCPGQEVQMGNQYKIPTNGNYGSDYQQVAANSSACSQLIDSSKGGTVRYGTNWWNAVAGTPSDPEAKCAAYHNGTMSINNLNQAQAMSFKFVGPNPGSGWVRGYSWYHDGVDIAAPEGNAIHAVAAGQIIWAGYDATNGFGWSIVINHCFGVSSLYGHLQNLSSGITIGANVNAGQVIGYEGSTGWSTGPHLHISVMVDNSTVDPMLFFADVNAITKCGAGSPGPNC